MPTYEVEVNGQKYDIDAPDDAAVQNAVRQLQTGGNTPPPAADQTQQGQQASAQPAGPSTPNGQADYYSSGIYAGRFNPLGKIASVLDPTYSSAVPTQQAEQTADTIAKKATADQQQNLDKYYSSGLYAGSMNPLGPIARSIDAATTGAQDMMTFGTSDELQGSMPGGNIDEARARKAALAQSNPVAYTAGQVAGAAPAANALGAVGGALRSIPGVGAVVDYGASVLPRVGPTLSTAIHGATTGAEMGGLYGYGSGEGGATDSSRIKNAALNAGIGATLGFGIPVAAAGVSGAYRNVADAAARAALARQAGVEPGVADFLTQRLQADNVLGPRGAANMAAAGPEAMLVDAGPSAQGALDAAVQQGGAGASLAAQRVGDRVARHSQAVNTALDTAMGAPQGVETAQAGIRTASAPARQTAYDAAYATPVNYASREGQQLENMVNNRVPQSTINEANRLMRLDGHQSQQIHADVDANGNVTYRTMPDVRQLDYITRALNQAAESGEGQGAMGGQTTLGRAYQNLSRDIRSTLRTAVPEYGTALETAADPIRQTQMVRLGSNLLSNNTTRETVRDAVDGITGPERDALAQGIRSSIDDTMANVKRTVMRGDTSGAEAYKAIKDMSSRANRDKMVMALGPGRAQPLLDLLDEAGTSFQAQGNLATGSRTAGRTETIRAVKDMNAPGPVGTLASGEPLNAGKRILQALTGNTPAAKQALTDESFRQIADVLTRPANQAVQDFRAMTNYGGQTALNQARANTVARILSASRPIAYPLAARQGERQR